MIFYDRREAGRQLAEELVGYRGRQDVKVIALPRGGVPVAFEVAKELDLALDVLVVRKIGIPDNSETAMGAISINNVTILDEDLIKRLKIDKDDVEEVINREQKELDRRYNLYYKNRKPLNLKEQIVIIIDDGIATGATMKAAIEVIKKQQAKKIIIAVPVASKSAYKELQKEVNSIICLHIPDDFYAVGQWYKHFSQYSDEEVQVDLSQF